MTAARIPLAVPILAGAALGAASAASPVADPDLYWHLATARDALAGGLVRADTFSWTATGAPVGVDQWLGQLVLYAGYALGGWPGVVAVRTIGVALLVGLTAAAALARRPSSPVMALAIAMPAILLGRFLWSARPELLGAACLAALVLLLQLPGERALVAIAPLLVVWAQLHGSFALGSGLVLLVAGYGLVRDPARRRGYAVALAGALASLVVTPAGLGTLGAPGLHVLDPARQIQEEAIPDPTTAPGAIWALVLGAVVATAALAPKARARDVLVVVPTAVLSLAAIRYVPLFAIAATPYLAERLPAALAVIGGLVGWVPSGSVAGGRLPRRAVDLAAILAAAVLLVGSAVAAPREIDESAYPVEALATLPAGPGVFAEYDWGGWLIWRAPRTPVFIDGRLTPYRGEVLRDYETILDARPGWRDVVARRGVRWILVRPTEPVAVRALDLGWPVRSRSPDHVLIEVPPSP